jgi:hypothetical protein
MIQSQLAKRRQLAIEGIAAELEKLTGAKVDLISGLRGNSEHRQLFMLERIFEAMQGQFIEVVQLEEADGEPCYTLTEILAIEGLSKTSQKALQAALDGSSD